MLNIRIRTAFIGIFVVFGLVLGLGGLVSFRAAVTLNASTMQFANLYLPGLKLAKELQLARAAFRDATLNFTTGLKSTPESKQAVFDRLADLKSKLAALGAFASAPEEVAVWKAATDLVNQYDVPLKAALDAVTAGDKATLGRLINAELTPIGMKFSAEMDKIVVFNETKAALAETAATGTYNHVVRILIVSGFVAVALLAGSAVFAVRRIANPIQIITEAMRTLAHGQLELQVPFVGRRDEIGEMAAAVEVFRQSAMDNQALQKQADLARQRDMEREMANARQVAESSDKLRFATDTLGDALIRLANGDVSFRIETPFAAEYDGLRHNFNASVAQLAGVVGAVLGSIDAMTSGTRSMAASAENLSRRTEQQAASLEETAAALDQITVNVASSAKRTEEARAVALLANQSASQSASVIGNTEEAMRRIEDSAQQISNIIGVIDEIAFQTNLLALNAGVEAARAGDAGKGFAVVAQEVRELAQRSATAAREIKALIHNSSQEVDNGVRLVRETGEALKAIGEHVSRINGLVEMIATASGEQSNGLAEVNVTLNQMDQGTQQNAAMAEESTAASASLAEEAEKLKSLIAHFKLSGNVSSQPTRWAA